MLAESSENNDVNRSSHQPTGSSRDTCPHCGQKLSPWQQVLLSIDRALVCRNCWYRIILDISENASETQRPH